MSPIENMLDKLDRDQIAMIVDGLDLLDEYYSTQSEFDKVIEVRVLKSACRDHIPKNLLN